jgi:hypothetical protein
MRFPGVPEGGPRQRAALFFACAGLCGADAAAPAEVDVAGQHGQEKLALGLGQAAQGELAQAGAFFQVGEAALGDGARLR